MDNLEYDSELIKVKIRFFIDKVSFNQTIKHFREVFGNTYEFQYESNDTATKATVTFRFVIYKTKLEDTMKVFREILGDSCEFEWVLNYVVVKGPIEW